MSNKVQSIKDNNSFNVLKDLKLNVRDSQRNQICSTNSISLSSYHKIESGNQKHKIASKQPRSSQKTLFKNKSGFSDLNQSQNNPKQILQQKMQNVSCLYSNFIYKNTKTNFIDDIRLERYRVLIENQRLQKNQLLKEVQQMKQKILEVNKQKQTVMFAYRALQAKIKQKQKRLMAKSKQKKPKVSINIESAIESKSLQTSSNQFNYQKQLKQTRQLLTSKGIVSFNQTQEINEKHIQTFNKFCSSKQLSKYLQNQNLIKEWQQKQKKFKQMTLEIQEYKQKISKIEPQLKNLIQKNKQLTDDIKFYKSQYLKYVQNMTAKQQIIEKHKSTIIKLQTQLANLQQKYNQINLKYIDQQRQDQRKKTIIKQLQDTKYSYLMKQQKQKQEIQLLKRFTQNLRLNDDKINEFIKQTFGNNIDRNQVLSQNKLYKEDISYILHLIKKKQNIYSELIKQYQEKHRQSQTRCFLIEKKMHFTDLFIKKLEEFLATNSNDTSNSVGTKAYQQKRDTKFKSTNNSTNLTNNQHCSNASKTKQQISKMIQNFKLDRRII